MSDNISKIDKNFAIKSEKSGKDIVFYDVRHEPFDVYGLYDYKNQPVFKRLPDEVAKNTNEGVAELYLNTAGGRVRFSTDSQYIAIKVSLKNAAHFSHCSKTGTSGIDMYIDYPDGNSRYKHLFIPELNMTDGVFESKIKLSSRQMRYFTLNFPSYSGVEDFYVGVSEDAEIGGGLKYKNELPVVFYGSSITQGGCASRPGNIYQNVISRRMGLDYINLGFSGNGRAEDTIVDYMAGLPMCAFVCDYDHNAPNAEHLRATHCNMYKKIRATHPDIPYIMVSRHDFDCEYDKNIIRRDVIIDTYRYARESGDRNVYYIDGASIYRGPYEDMCTVDMVHPNDLGFALLADAIGAELKRAFTQNLM